jgi:hypothetical protein
MGSVRQVQEAHDANKKNQYHWYSCVAAASAEQLTQNVSHFHLSSIPNYKSALICLLTRTWAHRERAPLGW